MTLDEIKLMSACEAAEVLGVNPHVVYDLWNRGLLDFRLIHRTLKTNITTIAAFLEKMREAARAAVNAAKAELQIHSPSKVFRDEVGAMTMKGLGEGVLKESKAQADTIRNAARYLTGEAKTGSITTTNTDNRKTYNTSSTVSFEGANFFVHDAQDAYALAVEIAGLTRRQQRGKGLRMA